MAIAMTCECGLTVRAREEHAGKRIKCPQCGKVAVVSAAAPSASPSRALERQAFPLQLDEMDAGFANPPAPRYPAPAAAPVATPKPPGVDPWGRPDESPFASPAPIAGDWRNPSPMLTGLIVVLRALAWILFVICGFALLVIFLLATGSTFLGFASAWLLLPQTIFLFLCGIALLVASESIRVGIDGVQLLREIRDELRLTRHSA